MISAIVLAAGQSTRMGGENKLLLPFRGGTLIENMVDVVTASRAGETIVVLGHEADRLRPLLAEKPVILADNPAYREGMSSSVRAGLGRVSPQATGAMICLTDQPLLEPEDLDRLMDALAALIGGEPENGGGPPKRGDHRQGDSSHMEQKSIVVPVFQGRRGNPVLFTMRHRVEVMAARGPVGGCKGIVKRHPEAVLRVEMANDHILRDMDTPEDYAALREQAGRSGATET